ncbi:MAG: adenylate/guanylate cyclase domain-containing protein [Dehalococcoidia bacterium]
MSIAYSEVGEGQTIVRVPPVPWSHVQVEWERFPGFLVTKQLTRGFRTAWYDSRGSGLSDRENLDFSIDSLVADLEAVVEKLNAPRVALCAVWDGIPVAVQYAATHPERVTHLVLIEGYTKGSDYLDSPAGDLEFGIREKDWVLYTETLARLIWGFDDPEYGLRAAEYFRACTDPQALRAAYDAVNRDWDITQVAAMVSAPTLVINNQNLPWLPARAGQRLAAIIPNARFSTVNDLKYQGMPDLVERFLGGDPTPASRMNGPSPFRTVLFTDIVGHTEMMQRLGDERGRDVLREHERITRETLKAHGGAEVKTMGDGFLASFGSVTQAMDCAIALQRAFAAHTESMPEPLHVRVGLNAGEPIEEDGDLFGAAVILASRIAAQAGAGEILIPEPVRHLLSGKSYVYSDRGEFAMKGFEEPVRVYEVRWRE